MPFAWGPLRSGLPESSVIHPTPQDLPQCAHRLGGRRSHPTAAWQTEPCTPSWLWVFWALPWPSVALSEAVRCNFLSFFISSVPPAQVSPLCLSVELSSTPFLWGVDLQPDVRQGVEIRTLSFCLPLGLVSPILPEQAE